MDQRNDVQQAIANRLPMYMADLPNWQYVVQVAGEFLQMGEDANWQLYQGQQDFSLAPTALLNAIGASLYTTRQGLSDARYADLLNTMLVAHISHGEEWRLAEVARRLLGGTVAIAVTTGWQQVSVQVGTPTPPSSAQVARALSVIDRAVGAGVLGRPVSWYYSNSGFGWLDDDTSLGWDDGLWAEAL
jgi:hypothetical protein